MVIGSLFSGIGGLELGLEWAGLGPVAWQVESDPFRRRVLRRHWPDARRYNDIRRFDGSTAARVSIICGGFPCQDVSLAGRGDGIHGSRTGLWWEMHRVIGEHRPLAVIIENVPGLALRGLDAVVDGLIDLGYMVEASRIRAADAGAPHLRGRLFILGYALRGRCEGRDEAATAERSDDR
jgi:DNA (cytosine-5)-methyltransferase 1